MCAMVTGPSRADRHTTPHEQDAVAEAPSQAPSPAHARALLDLQATAGNATVVRLLGKGAGEPLASGVRERVGPSLGAPLDGVRVHRDAEAADLARDLSARAFTTGSDVYFGAGEYA